MCLVDGKEKHLSKFYISDKFLYFVFTQFINKKVQPLRLHLFIVYILIIDIFYPCFTTPKPIAVVPVVSG